MKDIKITYIVDDDPIFVYATRKLLERNNFSKSYLISKNGRDALERIKNIEEPYTEFPDVILLDLNMPIMDGWEFLDEMSRMPLPKKSTVFIVSSSIDPADTNRSKKYNLVRNFIVKPISADKIKDLMTEV